MILLLLNKVMNRVMLSAFGPKLIISITLCLPIWAHSDSEATIKGVEAFETRWVIPFLSSGSWGRGPHSNAESCLDCHQPGASPFLFKTNSNEIQPVILRVRDGNGASGHINYGNEISRFGITGKLHPEGDFDLNWYKKNMEGHVLRYPSAEITKLNFGPLASSDTSSVRMGRDLTNIGMLDSITKSQLQDIVDEQKLLGLNGRINYVLDPITKTKNIGRYGYKASSPSLLDQVSKAFRDELGVTSVMYPINPCAGNPAVCSSLNSVGGLEISQNRIKVLSTFIRTTSQPRPQKTDMRASAGKNLFNKIGCNHCHRSDLYVLSEHQNDTQYDRALYTDLLIHDMGSGLSDGMKEFLARPEDWRTTPLSGIKKHLLAGGTLLHDGRAKSIKEAILWHDGEAKTSRGNYLSLDNEQKLLLEYFVRQL